MYEVDRLKDAVGIYDIFDVTEDRRGVFVEQMKFDAPTVDNGQVITKAKELLNMFNGGRFR